jgi:signal transduction histidine kinase
VKLIVSASDTEILLRIEDDGIGIQNNAGETDICLKAGMGIRNMTERVNLLQGKISIQSQPDHGTLIRVRIPILEATQVDG